MGTEVYNAFSNMLPQSGPITLNTNFSLGWIPVAMLGYFASIQWTGTPTGVFYLEASGEKYADGNQILTPKQQMPFFMKEQMANPSTNFTVGDSQYSVSAAGKNAWNVADVFYSFVRVSYTDNSGGSSTAQLIYAGLNQKGK